MHRSRRVAIAAALALAGLATGVVGGSADAAPQARVRAHINNGTLYVTGTHADDYITLRVRAATPRYLNIYVGRDPNWDLQIHRARFQRIVVNALSGDDVVRIDDTAGASLPFTTTTPTSLRGGADDDRLLGGSGAEDFRGGTGDDVVDGNQGDDVAWLGWGDDRFIWDPGDGSDRIEAGRGWDIMTFNGSGGDEVFESRNNHGRLRFTRSLGNIVMDVNDLERVDLNTLGGSDTVLVDDLRATDVKREYIDASGALGAAGGDGAVDNFTVKGTHAADDIDVSGAAGSVSVTGLVPAVSIVDAELTDRLTIASLAGNDTVDASALAADTMLLKVDAGDGHDDVRGGFGADTFLAGNGDDVVDGNQGNDVAWLGWGDDEFIWDPGDGSDRIEGRQGHDLMTFNGSGGDEIFDASANGARLRFFRNLGNIVMDTDDVERVYLNALGGADDITTNDLTGTDVRTIRADLGGALGAAGGDGAVDNFTVKGTHAADDIDVSGAAGSVSVTGLVPAVSIVDAELTDRLTIASLAGNDTVDASALAADTMLLKVDAGDGHDDVRGGFGADTFLAGNGDDVVDGNQGNDVAWLGWGDDEFIWDPGDGSDRIEGRQGHDLMTFNGSGGDEIFDASANGARLRFFRNLGNIVMDTDDVEQLGLNTLGGADEITLNDLTGTDVRTVDADLAGTLGTPGGDGVRDRLIVNGTDGHDAFTVSGSSGSVRVDATARLDISNAEASDELVVNGLGGADTIDDAGLAPGTIALTFTD